MSKKSQKYDIIIQAGQSNAEGYGRGSVTEEFIPDDKIMYLKGQMVESWEEFDLWRKNNNFAIEKADENILDGQKIGDFSLTFAESYIKSGLLAKDRKLLIVRAAVGGTGFMKRYWGMSDVLYARMLSMIDYALGLNDGNRLVAFLWHQGEHDVVEGSTALQYFNNLYNLVQSVRKTYNAQNLPFIAGDFASEWKRKTIDISKPIADQIKEICRVLDYAYFVETSDLKSNNQATGNGDDIHFCRESLHVLGRRYFDAYMLIKKATDICVKKD